MPMTQLFFLDAHDKGGLGLSNMQVGFIYNTVGVIALIGGGLSGGFVIARHGLKFWLWPMLLAIHLPDMVFIWLAAAQPENHYAISAGIAVEQFGYGFGFASYMLYMIYIARGPHRYGALRALHGFHGAGHDDSGSVERLAGGASRLQTIFHLGDAGDDSELFCSDKNFGGGRVWQKNPHELNCFERPSFPESKLT